MLSLHLSTIRLIEVATWAAVQVRTTPIERKYHAQVKLYFSKQGSAFVRKLHAQRSKFTVKEADTDEVSIPVNLDAMFDAAVAAIDKEFDPVFSALAGNALSAGYLSVNKDFKLALSFDVAVHPAAKKYLKDYGSKLISNLNDTSKSQINTIVTEGLLEGASYNTIERRIIERFRSFSVKPVRAASHIRTRAELVAINETGNAYQTGNYTAIVDASKTGLKFKKKWLTVGDKRVSDGCSTNEAQGYIDVTSDHSSGHLHPCRFPGCRCTEVYSLS